MNAKELVLREIREKSHISISRFMEICLSSSSNAYYKTKDPFSAEAGDFITAPEISQMFGEMIGVWIYKEWLEKYPNKNINLIELGPGTGILMRDVLRILDKTVMRDKIRVYLYDINELLIARQQKNLEQYPYVNWLKSLDDLPQSCSIFIANEFFDAMPIEQFIMSEGQWRRRVIKYSRGEMDNLEYFFFDICSHQNFEDIKNHPNAPEGAILEESPGSNLIISKIAEHICSFGGSSLIIDYGYDLQNNTRNTREYSSSLQAIRHHKYCDLFENMGFADITAHVDFGKIKNIANQKGCKVESTITQRKFLLD